MPHSLTISNVMRILIIVIRLFYNVKGAIIRAPSAPHRRAGTLRAAVFASGCANLAVMSHVPLSTTSRLSSLKLAEIDAAELRLAARLPDRCASTWQRG